MVFAERITALDRSTRTAMVTALMVVAAIAVYGWTVSPHLAYLQAVQSYEPVVKNVADKKRGVAKALGAKRRTLQKRRGELAALHQRCFTPDEAIEFFGQLERRAQEAGCSVTSVDFTFERRAPTQPTASDRPIVVAHRANLTVSGVYDGVIKWLDYLQGRPQAVYIDTCSLEFSDTGSRGLKGDLTIVILIGLDPGDSSDT